MYLYIEVIYKYTISSLWLQDAKVIIINCITGVKNLICCSSNILMKNSLYSFVATLKTNQHVTSAVLSPLHAVTCSLGILESVMGMYC